MHTTVGIPVVAVVLTVLEEETSALHCYPYNMSVHTTGGTVIVEPTVAKVLRQRNMMVDMRGSMRVGTLLDMEAVPVLLLL